jgi:hypothetical protein
MSTSTMERTSARLHEPSHLAVADLIRTIAGRELPAVGPWSVGSGQLVTLSRRRLRRRSVEARVRDGTFTVAEDPAASTLDLVLDVSGTTGAGVRLSSRSARSVEVGYHGVFRQRGRSPSMWLVVGARLELPELRDLLGSGEVALHAELNLSPPLRCPVNL